MHFSRTNHLSLQVILSVSVGALLAGSTLAHADGDDDDHEGEHFDIGVWNDGGTLRTGGWDHDEESLEVDNLRVFEGEFGEDPEFPWAIDEPGIGGVAADLGLPTGATLQMNMAQGLGVWNGSGFDQSSSKMFVGYGPASMSSAEGGSLDFLITEDYDLHPVYSIVEDSDVGSYLLEFNFSMDNFGTSESIWIVFNLGLDHEDYEASVEWVESNLVPAPAVLPALGMAALFGRRRRS